MDDAARIGYDWTVIRDGDSMVAEGEALEWLMHQLIEWPRRVDPERTTNDSFLRCSAARTLEALRARLDVERERCLLCAEGLAEMIAARPHHEQPIMSNAAAWARTRDAALDIADAIRSGGHPMTAQPIEARSVGTACGSDPKDESVVAKPFAQPLGLSGIARCADE